MIWAQAVLPLIFGLAVAFPVQLVQARRFFNYKNLTHTSVGNVNLYESDNTAYIRFVCQGKRNGLRLPISDSCTKFFECQEEQAKLRICQEGKHFSKEGLTCIDAELSKCQSKAITIKCEGPCCGKEDGLYADKEDCGNFIVCLNKQAEKLPCGGSFLFNEQELICDIPERSQCANMIDRKIEYQVNLNTPQHQLGLKKPIMYMLSHRVCRKKPNGTTVGIFGSCNKYYLCVNGEGHLKSCGSLQFNHAGHFCDSRPRIFCPEIEADDIIMAEDEYPMVDEIRDPLAPEVAGPFEQTERPLAPNYPQWGSETQFKPEVDDQDKGQGWHLWEPKPTHPSHEHNRPPIAEPGQHPGELEHPVPPNQIIPTEPIPQPPILEKILDPKDFAHLCADKSIGALVPLPNYCHKYIRCRWDWIDRRVAEIVACPKNKQFNAKAKKCDVPEKAGCVINPHKTNKRGTALHA